MSNRFLLGLTSTLVATSLVLCGCAGTSQNASETEAAATAEAQTDETAIQAVTFNEDGSVTIIPDTWNCSYDGLDVESYIDAPFTFTGEQLDYGGIEIAGDELDLVEVFGLCYTADEPTDTEDKTDSSQYSDEASYVASLYEDTFAQLETSFSPTVTAWQKVETDNAATTYIGTLTCVKDDKNYTGYVELIFSGDAAYCAYAFQNSDDYNSEHDIPKLFINTFALSKYEASTLLEA